MFTNMKKYARHKRIDHKDKKEFPCGGCNLAFATNSKLVKHIQYVHEGKCKCKQCGKDLSSMDRLKKHMKYVHEGVRDEKCEICNKWFAGKKTLTTWQRVLLMQNVFRFSR